METATIRVEGRNGLRGTIPTIPPDMPPSGQVELTLDNGQCLLIPAESLVRRTDGTYSVPLSPSDLNEAATRQSVVVPVVREEVRIDKRAIDRGKVTVHVSSHVRKETVDVTLADEQVDVQRVPVNRIVDSPVPVREENGTTIIPVYEEVLVVEKRLRIKEEVRVTRRRTTRREKQEVTLRSEEATVHGGGDAFEKSSR